MTDPLLERLTAPAPAEARDQLRPIPWPKGLKPTVLPYGRVKPDSALPRVDVVVMAYTYAEKQATADVLSPGAPERVWAKYAHNWAAFEPHLTSRSPARDARCLAYVQPVKIGAKRVMLVGCNLHLSTDDETMPVVALVKQIAAETGCELFITTGTAGGVGAGVVLGDVVIAKNVKFNLADSPWESEAWAQRRFPAPAVDWDGDLMGSVFSTMIPAAIRDGLKPSGYASRPPQLIVGKDIETVGYFAFADTADTYGVVANDPGAGCEEMDDGAVALAFGEMEDAPRWLACRNASDPQMGGGPLATQKAQAERIYDRYGYLTTVCSSLAVWAVIASQ